MSLDSISKANRLKRCTICGDFSEQVYCSEKCQAFKQGRNPLKRSLDLIWGIRTMLGNKHLLKLSIVPLALSVFILALALWFGLDWFQAYLSGWISLLLPQGFWSGSLKAFLLLFSWFSAGLFFVVLFLPISALIMMPFMDPVSGHVEAQLLKASPGISLNIPYLLKEIFWLTLFKIVLIAPALLALLIPILGPVIFAFLLSLSISLDFLDLIWMRKKYVFTEKLLFLRQNKLAWFFYNLPLMLMIWVPILQILIIPGAAVGAVRFYLNAQKRRD